MLGAVVFQYRLASGDCVTLSREVSADTPLEAIREALEHLEELALQEVEGDESGINVAITLARKEVGQ